MSTRAKRAGQAILFRPRALTTDLPSQSDKPPIPHLLQDKLIKFLTSSHELPQQPTIQIIPGRSSTKTKSVSQRVITKKGPALFSLKNESNRLATVSIEILNGVNGSKQIDHSFKYQVAANPNPEQKMKFEYLKKGTGLKPYPEVHKESAARANKRKGKKKSDVPIQAWNIPEC